MKTSTGRESLVKHSTGNEKTSKRKAHHGQPLPRTSTGEGAGIVHLTGRRHDFKRRPDHQPRPKPGKGRKSRRAA